MTSYETTVDVPGGAVWVRVAGQGDRTPLVLLHGGPGASSDYLEPLAELGDERRVVLYDQLGGGRSERPEGKYLWTVDRFVRELTAVTKALGLERFHLFGHSWGAALALEYLRPGDSGAESVIFASPLLSASVWIEDVRELLKGLSKQSSGRDSSGGTGTTDEAQTHESIKNRFMKAHFCRLDPWPSSIKNTIEATNQTVYETMWGPDELTLTGSLSLYHGTAYLPTLKIPVLFIVGRHDEVRPASVARYAEETHDASVEIIEDASHMGMVEQPEAYLATVRSFLHRVEKSGPAGGGASERG